MKLKLLFVLFLTFSFSYSQVTKEIMEEMIDSTKQYSITIQDRIIARMNYKDSKNSDIISRGHINVSFRDEGILLSSGDSFYFMPYNNINFFHVGKSVHLLYLYVKR